MLPKDTGRSTAGNLFRKDLKDFINLKHFLIMLGEAVNWEHIEQGFRTAILMPVSC